MSKGRLFLIPGFLGNFDSNLMSPHNLEIIHALDEFIVENEKPARAVLKASGTPIHQNDFTFHLMGKHSDPADYASYLRSCKNGKNVGLLSDAGLPCVADPGFEIVRLAHKNEIEVVPLIGMSSIMLTLMASGFNGQSFKFHGYLPHDEQRKKKILKQAASDVKRNETQIFIETPYRNGAFIKTLQNHFQTDALLCVGVDLTMETQSVVTRQLKDWTQHAAELHKRPAVFILGL